ncbi:MAG: hypothetical protein HYY93_16370 [Planctomycetes bacterium]|nr:hypothetical protein [Planctomycetota bacterium]
MPVMIEDLILWPLGFLSLAVPATLAVWVGLRLSKVEGASFRRSAVSGSAMAAMLVAPWALGRLSDLTFPGRDLVKFLVPALLIGTPFFWYLVLRAACRAPRVKAVACAVFCGMCTFPSCVCIVNLHYPHHQRWERYQPRAAFALKKLIDWEVRARELDLDGNGTKDYWTRDVAGLVHLATQGSSSLDGDSTLAQADIAPGMNYPDSPQAPVPRFGYFLMAMKFDADGNPLVSPNLAAAEFLPRGLPPGASTHTNRFAFCAFPSHYGKNVLFGDGVLTLIVSEEGRIWAKDLGPGARGVDRWPSGNIEEAGWQEYMTWSDAR